MNHHDDVLDKQRKKIIPQDLISGNPDIVLVFENLCTTWGCETEWGRGIKGSSLGSFRFC